MTSEHTDLHTLTEQQLLAEMLLQLRENTRLLGYLMEETGDFHMTVKEDMQNRQLW